MDQRAQNFLRALQRREVPHSAYSAFIRVLTIYANRRVIECSEP